MMSILRPLFGLVLPALVLGAAPNVLAFTQYSPITPIGHEFLTADSASSTALPELAPGVNDFNASNANCGSLCDTYGTRNWRVWSAVIGQRWVDVMGFSAVDQKACFDSVAQENDEVQYDHFLRKRCDAGSAGRKRAIAESIARFRKYFLDAVGADEKPITVGDGGTTSSQKKVLRAWFLFGRAVHLFQDSFSPEHGVRSPDGKSIIDIKSYGCTEGSQQHGHALPHLMTVATGDIIWNKATSPRAFIYMKEGAPRHAHAATADLWRAFVAARKAPGNASAQIDAIIQKWMSWSENGGLGGASEKVMAECRASVRTLAQIEEMRRQCLRKVGNGGLGESLFPPLAGIPAGALGIQEPPRTAGGECQGRFGFHLVRTESWGLGWTRFVTFELDGKVYLISYQGTTGKVSVDELAEEAKWRNVGSGNWGTGWKFFLRVLIGGLPHLISVKDTGATWVEKLAPQVAFQSAWKEKWSTSWTHFLSFPLGGESHVLSYTPATRDLSIDRIRAGGWTSLTKTKFDYPQDGFIPLVRPGSTVLASYHGASGFATLDRVEVSGKLSRLRTEQWGNWWSGFTAFGANGETHLVSYNATTGHLTVDAFTSNDAWRNRLTRFIGAGFTNVVTLTRAGSPYLIFYSQKTGQALIARIST